MPKGFHHTSAPNRYHTLGSSLCTEYTNTNVLMSHDTIRDLVSVIYMVGLNF
ncbi:hypothetical protein Tsubulata_043648 [Turnera subulata]|uniref:Uncharacterized protein n=1 Tax=Turnera subulata TaxID=218843 RepID=A0A9Q0FIR9_9ROSI|nr:hypothetical protein Tsubulata_043648 [Turnera subulata]